MDATTFKSKYVQIFFRVSDFLKHKKNTYLRFRINFSWESGLNKRGETLFNELLRDYTGNSDVSCYGIFILGYVANLDVNAKISELFDRYNAKIIITQSHHIAGIKFSDPKHKEIFLLRYKEYFPDSSLIK
jgi:hypothetical protein